MAAKTTKQQSSERFATFIGLAVRLAKVTEADALLTWVTRPSDLEALTKGTGELTLLVGSDDPDVVQAAADAGLDVVFLTAPDLPLHEKLEQALLQSIADEILSPGAGVIAVYSGFESNQVDTVSFIRLEEHLGRLTIRDLRNLETRVPLDTLKTVVDLAVDIGREGREGKPVGTLLIVGDSRKVLANSHPTGFDPVKGYGRRERSLSDSRVREGIKEIAQLDGAFVVSADGTVEASCQLIETAAANVTLSKGLGTRHWAAAAITKKTNAVAVTVSETSGTVRIFQNGEVILRIEPFRRPMKWRDFEYDAPPPAESRKPS
jgi:DNA integrity scanning protein DisA with diadenylate cyclase activity